MLDEVVLDTKPPSRHPKEVANTRGADIIMPDNGMAERFNRRLGNHLGRVLQKRAAHHRRFHDHAERDAYLHTFVADYNRTRLRCLDYQAPAELLAKLVGQNTYAGAGFWDACRQRSC